MDATTQGDPTGLSGSGNSGAATPNHASVAREGAIPAALYRLRQSLQTVVQGQERAIELGLACLLARGHLLLEDVPGTGKTTLARAFASATGLAFQRIQMTADLLPSDLTGARFPVFSNVDPGFSNADEGLSKADRGGPELRFVAGPLFSQVVLADELNRTPPRTQSALLECMGEGQVTVEGERHRLPRPFFVVATQNPIEFAGTFPLPESQLDRFMMRLSLGYPGREAERAILRDRRAADPLEALRPAIEAETLDAAISAVDDVQVHGAIEDYMLDIAHATRTSPAFELGVSPRGVIDLDRAARAVALLDGRTFVVPDDVRRLALPVLAHRTALRDLGAQPFSASDPAAGSGGATSVEELELEALLANIAAPTFDESGSLVQ